MTLNGAIMELVMLSEHPMMPVIFKPSMQKIIETVSECEEPERKTGRWETVKANPRMIHCTNCMGIWWNKEFIEVFKYCPNCGAKMGVNNDKNPY